MAVREGKWRCSYCEGVNRGAEPKCAGCGATRDKDVRFFLEDDAAEVLDPKLLERARSGAEWLCLFCSTSSPATAGRCTACGAERGTAPARPVLERRDAPPGPPVAPARSRAGLRRGVAVALLLALAFCSVAAWQALRKTNEVVSVAGFEWERAVEIEAFRTLRESAWEGELPPDARPLSRSSEVHHTEQEQVGTRRVKVGTRDLGNGFFEDVYEDRPEYRDRPVYATRIHYEVDRWVAEHTERASGHDQAPRWPEPALRPSQRQGNRRESYVVLLRGPTRNYRLPVPDLARWSAFREGQSFEAVIRGGATVLELRPR